ncbi:MAG: M48 family metallopeptidase [Bdellovibrionales bacterium]|nr:M48 family metallopeptidase [Bdellovibrionales bacterium]
MKNTLPLLLLFILSLSACVTLNETGQKKLLLTTTEQENQMGEEGYEEVLKTAKITKTEPVYSILQDVGSRIAAVANRPDFTWEYNLIDEDQLNAWCMPGGKIAVYTGILPFMKNEAGMAAVIGHEVAHATLRHSGQRISQEMGMSVILGVVSGGLQSSQNHDQIMGLLGAGATVGVMLPYGRKHETEADLIGLQYMARAGYDPQQAISFWERFAEITKGSAPPEFLSTHPGSGTRINDLQKHMSEAVALYKKAPKQYGQGRDLPTLPQTKKK